jgi:hypothetical protein
VAAAPRTASDEAIICDPVTLGLGMAASATGRLITRNSALNAAQAQANARNGVLSETIGGLDNIYNKTNAPAFGSAVNSVNINDLPAAQDAGVSDAILQAFDLLGVRRRGFAAVCRSAGARASTRRRWSASNDRQSWGRNRVGRACVESPLKAPESP